MKQKVSAAKRSKKTVADDDDESRLSEFSRRKREQILKAATETFLEFGYEGSSMNMVAERAGVIKQTIYSHFHEKETLFITAIAGLTVQRAEEIFTPEAVKELPPEQILRRLAKVIVFRDREASFAKLLRTIVGESARFPKIAKLFTQATIKPSLDLLTGYLRDHPNIHLPDPEAFARIFIGTLIHYGMQQNVLYGNKLLPFESSRLIDELIRIFHSSSSYRKDRVE